MSRTKTSHRQSAASRWSMGDSLSAVAPTERRDARVAESMTASGASDSRDFWCLRGGCSPHSILFVLVLVLILRSCFHLSSSLSGMGRLTGRLFVLFTTCLISFIAYSSQIFVIWPWYGREFSVELVQLLLPFKSVWAASVHSAILTRANAVYS